MVREEPPKNAGLPESFRLRPIGASQLGAWSTAAAWGAAAALCLTAAAFLAQSGPGQERLQHIFTIGAPTKINAATLRKPEVESRVAAEQAKIRHLAEEVRTLSSDRDRLVQRVASLEQHFEAVTGSIAPRPAPAPAPPKEDAVPSTAAAPIASVAPPDTPQRPPPPASAFPVRSERPLVQAPQPSVASMEPASITPDVTRPTKALRSAAVPEKDTSKASTTLQHDETDAKLPALVPLPPRRRSSHRVSTSPSFGVDLGSAASVDEVKAQWAAIKANFGPILVGLDSLPIHDFRPGQGPYRLVIGRLPNMAAAHNLCAQFAVGHVACKPVALEGQYRDARINHGTAVEKN